VPIYGLPIPGTQLFVYNDSGGWSINLLLNMGGLQYYYLMEGGSVISLFNYMVTYLY
jgi:hypothetical protein